MLGVPKETKIGNWALFGRRLREFFWERLLQAGERGGEFEKTAYMQKSQVWEKLNGHENKGSDLRFVKHFPNIIGQFNQSDSLGGFDSTKKSICASVSTASRLVRASHLKWTQAHFSLKITVDLVGEGKQTVSWGITQPILSGPIQTQHLAPVHLCHSKSIPCQGRTRKRKGRSRAPARAWAALLPLLPTQSLMGKGWRHMRKRGVPEL